MDPILNPYSPGAGMPPPELAGRQDLMDRIRIALERARMRRPAKSVLAVGLRGVGKTVLLLKSSEYAESKGMLVTRVEAPESRSLPALLGPGLRLAMIQLEKKSRASELARRALRGLAGFAGALKVKYQDIEFGLDLDPEPGLADNGDLELDLQALLEAVGEACASADTGLVMFVDELQYVAEEELAALVVALHRAAQRSLPITLVGAGLPQLRGRMGRAKSYAERLFDFPEVGPLSAEAALTAIIKPARDLGVDFQPEAVDMILRETEGYPYFLQEWGKHVWDVAEETPITASDVRSASAAAVATLDEGFFMVRFDRSTQAERRYLRAMAELGPGPHRSGQIAAVLDRDVTSLAPMRAQLISKGMIWSPSHGDTAFTVPRFDRFMRRILPGDDWRS
ncbi:MAG: ATP-binding protein [Gemmatimonadota bacterium]|uniref:ATP-binding protein n=1 Tax=Candidatus Palauibacter scopulicola TaxID=3056741 RepID=UPI0023995247|nr:ATP-binding protein [Candidatus Palauibacter scopulicola]MDE2662254.1 ATP-binding protein [Candidatus Palauibacter scopulicola]